MANNNTAQSFKIPSNNSQREQEQSNLINGSSATLDNYNLFRSPSLSDTIVKMIRETTTPASRYARQLWRRVQIATGINLRTAENIVSVVEKLKMDEKQSSANFGGDSSQRQLEDLFLQYLRLNAPDRGVALSFLHAMNIQPIANEVSRKFH